MLNEELLDPSLASDYEALTQKTELLNSKQQQLEETMLEWEQALENLEEFE